MITDQAQRKYAHNIRSQVFFDGKWKKSRKSVLYWLQTPSSAVKNQEIAAMANQIQRESAEIIQFRPRSASTKNSSQFEVKSKTDTSKKQTATAVCYDSWYHQAEIEADARPVKN